MSKRSELKNHIHSLHEIKNIISAMKNLSLIEISKLNKIIPIQNELMSTLQESTADFTDFYPFDLSSFHKEKAKGYILIGSERGFCGDFNEKIIHHFQETSKNDKAANPPLIVIGHKLSSKMLDTTLAFEGISGPNVAEEIQTVINTLVKTLENFHLQSKGKINLGSWSIISNTETKNILQPRTIRPLGEFGQNKIKNFPDPPVLNLSPDILIIEVMDHYFFSMMHHLFQKSFMAESRQRLLHMEGAIEWLEKNSEQLMIKYNRIRQEEITEEIELILLSIKAVVEEMNV